ncbi:MAG: hypothetical protein COA88_13540, partial [Kordia sp.]
PAGPTAGAGGVISGMTLGTAYTVTTGNGSCISAASVSFTNLAMLLTPVTNVNQDMILVCDDDFDGIMSFDLTSNIGAITGGTSDVAVTFYNTQAEADSNTNSLTAQGFDVTAYENQNPIPPVSQEIIWVRVQNDVTGCYSVTSFTITVNTVMFTAPINLYTCDDDNDTFGFFDLSLATAQMTGGAINLEVTFHETLAEAEVGVGAIPTGVLYQNVQTSIAGQQTLYLNITDTDTGCSYTAETIVLNVLASPVVPEGPLTYALCEDVGSTDGIVVFNLLDYAENDLGIDPALFGVIFYEEMDALGNLTVQINNPGSYTNTPDQVIYIAVSNSNMDSNGDACTTVKAIILKVDSLPAADHYLEYTLCDNDYFDNMDQTQTFDLPSQLPNMIASTDGLVITYYQVWDDVTGIYSEPIQDVNLENYQNTANPQDIFVEFVNEVGCSVVKILKLTVSPNPTPLTNIEIIDTLGNNGVMEECDGNIDGSGDISEQIAIFDITQWETSIINNEDGVSVAYYITEDDAAAGINAISNPVTYNNISNPQTIYVGVINDGTGVPALGTGCTTVVQFDIHVPVPQVTVTASKDVICVDVNGVPLTNTALPVLTATVGPEEAVSYDYQWMLNGVVLPGATAQEYTVTEPGDYTVTVSGPMDFDCINYSAIQTITVSGSPDAYNASVTTLAFADSHQVVATATSSIPGIVFWYSLDGGEPTTNGTFNDVSPGIHIVTITDGQGCWSNPQEVMIVDYPHFFTPNGDGVNDTWAIIQQEGIPISQIYIFDRFGKLLKQLDPDSAGWDGTYNGSQMPATDYWFKILYIEGANNTQKEFKAHFSIKR